MAVTINTVAWDFANIDIVVDIVEKVGTEFRTLESLAASRYFREINYAPKVEVEDMYGGDRNPQDQTDGRASHEASVTLEKYGFDHLFGSIAALGKGWAQVRLMIGIQFYKPGLPIEVDTIWAAKILGAEQAYKAGQEGLMVPVTLKPLNIFIKGVDPFGKTL